MLFMVILVGMGERMAERFLPIYLLALGGGALSIGFLSGLDNLLSALYSFSGGYLSERIGTKRALLVFNIIAMCGFIVVILIPAWGPFWWERFFFSHGRRFPCRHHGPDRQGTSHGEENHGCYHAFVSSKNTDGAGTDL